MRLKFYFILLSIFILASWVILFYFAVREHGMWFYIAEILLTMTLFVLFIFYRKVVKPMRSIANGMELLREQDFNSRLTTVGQTEADRIVMVFNRMMDQLKNERLRLREQNHFLDLLISASPMGVVILTFDQQISMINKAALKFTGFESENEVKGLMLSDIDSILIHEITKIPIGTTSTIRLSDSQIYRCAYLSFIDRGFEHPFILIESLTSEVIKAEKKAYEKVIRMISHEVNNTVAGISSTLQSVTDILDHKEENGDLCDIMRICIERSYSMSRFITNFADVVKIPEPDLKWVDLNMQLINSKIFMENLCNINHVKLHLDLCTDSLMVKLDAELFEQVIINIIKNSIESIGENGDITIRTSRLPNCLEIIDTGRGIDKEDEAKLFTPFFSTKPNGQGIGLIFIRDVLTKHDCTFSLRTISLHYTSFKIVFNKSQ